LGQIRSKELIISIVCLVLTGLMINLIPSPTITPKTVMLRNSLNNIEGWRNLGFNPLEEKIIDVLYLDDYVNMNFSNGKEIVSLYVGYYLSNKKVGAAHDPLVCFPGQGWKLTNKSTDKLQVTSSSVESISYSMMVGTLGQQKELIVYWFQAYDTANANTFSQKLALFFNRILQKGEDNAFVRITILLNDRSVSECKDIVDIFIKNFYPVFLEYIKNK
jgi:EpsI family protein